MNASQPPSAMFPGPWADIDHAALLHNLSVVRVHASSSQVWAVVKANAYGHGMAQVSSTLAEAADGLAVARVEEGARLREVGIARPILVLEGASSEQELAAACEHRLELALHSGTQVALLEQQSPGCPIRVWIKVDTGMHRLGFDPQEVSALLRRLSGINGVDKSVGLMTHLANADDALDELTNRQCERLRGIGYAASHCLSIANSAGVLAHPASRTHWVRPGIMLYGASPLIGQTAAELGLRPAMTLRTRLIAIRSLRRGDAVGYGGTYVCPEDMSVGVAAIGYGDGYPRHAPTGTPVLVGGRRATLVGRVSMDMLSIDLRAAPDSRVGDLVTLWGEGLPADEIAEHSGTISYELFCHVTTRVHMRHIGVQRSGCSGSLEK